MHSFFLASELVSLTWLDAGKKIAHLLHVALPVLPLQHVAALEGHSPDFRDALEPRVHAEVGDPVRLAVNKESLNLDIVRLLPALPALDRTNYDKLFRPLAVCPSALDTCWRLMFDGLCDGTHMVRETVGSSLRLLDAAITFSGSGSNPQA